MKRTYLMLIITMLVIGFAAVTTNLVINGTINIGFNEDEFNVYFSYARIDTNESKDLISKDKQTITFTTNELTDINQTSTLYYEVTNNSKQYDAEVEVRCDGGTELYSIENTLKDETIEAKSIVKGKVEVKLNAISTEDKEIKFECHLDVSAISRNEEENKEVQETCHYDEGFEWNFDYTGQEETFTAPCNGTYKIQLWGAQGGDATDSYVGGLGSYVEGTISFSQAQTLYVYVGERGTSVNNNETGEKYNGGGGAITQNLNDTAGTGGGATDVRLINGSWDAFESLKSRIMVAAGGGGSYCLDRPTSKYIGTGGSGGGLKGISPTKIECTNRTYTFGNLPTQNSKASANNCGNAVAIDNLTNFGKGGNIKNWSSGGGGGYYGGSSGFATGSSGGSSFISGHEGCDAIAQNSTESEIQHTGKSEHYSKLVFTNTVMIDGDGYQWTSEIGTKIDMPTHDGSSKMVGNAGNGYAKITLVKTNNLDQ